ncbi:MAG: hypothetical protein NTX73_08425 [Rhodobacterales bacterium]|jgi:hypothetical protein|nr:hypothetical protein [Rhodobacterales bacterium]
MNWFFGGFMNDLHAAWHGPLAFRLILQPLLAAALGVRAGLQDAKTGRPPLLERLGNGATARRRVLREGWADIGRLFIIAVVADLAYQLIANQQIHPGQGLVAALVLAVPAYILTRGPTNRIARRRS